MKRRIGDEGEGGSSSKLIGLRFCFKKICYRNPFHNLPVFLIKSLWDKALLHNKWKLINKQEISVNVTANQVFLCEKILNPL